MPAGANSVLWGVSYQALAIISVYEMGCYSSATFYGISLMEAFHCIVSTLLHVAIHIVALFCMQKTSIQGCVLAQYPYLCSSSFAPTVCIAALAAFSTRSFV
jgi:hypothetical protein